MYENTHNFRTILNNEHGYIGYCHCCQMVNVCFHSSLFCFKLNEFHFFYDTINERRNMFSFCTSHGKEVMLKTPMSNYFILFTEVDLIIFEDMLRESTLLIEAFNTINNQN